MSLTVKPRPSVDGQHFHVVVIGGGINGVAVARECARAGKNTLLVEQNDFASGVTSRSTRIIHGGLRYLDRKSTRLNSSHSLLDALPICGAGVRSSGKEHAAGRAERFRLWSYQSLHAHHPRRPALPRSEEHTSELQSLPTRRSSDLWRGSALERERTRCWSSRTISPLELPVAPRASSTAACAT